MLAGRLSSGVSVLHHFARSLHQPYPELSVKATAQRALIGRLSVTLQPLWVLHHSRVVLHQLKIVASRRPLASRLAVD